MLSDDNKILSKVQQMIVRDLITTYSPGKGWGTPRKFRLQGVRPRPVLQILTVQRHFIMTKNFVIRVAAFCNR